MEKRKARKEEKRNMSTVHKDRKKENRGRGRLKFS